MAPKTMKYVHRLCDLLEHKQNTCRPYGLPWPSPASITTVTVLAITTCKNQTLQGHHYHLQHGNRTLILAMRFSLESQLGLDDTLDKPVIGAKGPDDTLDEPAIAAQWQVNIRIFAKIFSIKYLKLSRMTRWMNPSSAPKGQMTRWTDQSPVPQGSSTF